MKRRPGGSLLHLLFFPLLVLPGCDTPLEDTRPPVPAALIYMVANNNLDYYAMVNIKQMERGISGDRVVFDKNRPEMTDEQPAEFAPANFATWEERNAVMKAAKDAKPAPCRLWRGNNAVLSASS
jgi:hypothetical protein